MNNLPRTSGIYKITCTANGKIYIGSAANLRRRWNEHTRYLRDRVHRNPYLQHCWDKYGSECFSIEVLEFCESHVLIEREQYYIDTLRPFEENGFNVAKIANAPMAGERHTLETIRKIIATQKRTRDLPDYVFISPNGERLLVDNLNQFCRDNGLTRSAMSNVAMGFQPHHKGWRKG